MFSRKRAKSLLRFTAKESSFENSDMAIVNGEEKTICAKVLRIHDQLYMPAPACELFDMRWAYAKRNNFISFEHESEDRPITVQP